MKHIDADKLLAEIERRKQIHKSNVENGFPDEANKITEDNDILYIIKSLQQEQPDGVLIPKWCLENIENTLRIQHIINNDAKDGETCQDRNIKESLNCVRKLLNGEEITGRERSEPLIKQPEDLVSEIEAASKRYPEVSFAKLSRIAKRFYELGLNAKEESK